MGIVRSIIKLTDNEMEKAYDEPNEAKACGKAIVTGCVEGFIDAAAVIGAIGVILSTIGIAKDIITKK